MQNHRRLVQVVLSVISLHLLACGGEDGGTGSVRVTAWGEDYIEEGISSSEFEDGWSVRYDTFLMVLGEVTLGKAGVERQALLPGTTLFDLTESGPFELGSLARLDEGEWSFSFASLVADLGTGRAEGVSADDLELMATSDFNVFVSGTATRDDTEKRFRWGFSEPVVYANCVDVGGGQEISGVVVRDARETTAQLTIHGDHLFYDDLASPNAKLRFEVIAAADEDDDGEVTLDELEQVRLSDLSSEQGSYGVGAADINDMRAFVAAATTSLGHFNGEGHCSPQSP